MVDFRAFAILPAAGCGERTSVSRPKQFCLVSGRPLIAYTLEMFERLPWMEEIYVAISSDWIEYMDTLITEYGLTKVRLLYGSTTRHRSIRNCVTELNKKFEKERSSNGTDNKEKVVIVHDAVRPFVDGDTLKRIAVAAKEHGASGAVRPLVSTVIASDEEGILDHSLVRSKYRESHTPQAFTHRVIRTAYEKITENDLEHGTECLHLALEYTGTKAKLLEAPDTVWKVTYRKDFFVADRLATENFSLVSLVMDKSSILARHLQASLREKNLQVGTTCMEMTKLPHKTDSIIFHKIKPTIESISYSCDRGITFLQKHSNHGGVITCIVSGLDIKDHWIQVHGVAQRVLSDLKQILIYFVMLDDKEHIEGTYNPAQLVKASDMVASIVYNRDKHLSGQVLVA